MTTMPPHRRLNLACGPHQLPEPWENFDREVDLCKPLPFEPSTAAFIHLEHAIEHLSFRSAMALLSDLVRVLEPGGVLRLCFPDATRHSMYLPAYEAFMRQRGHLHGVGSSHVLRQVLLGWNHQSAWSFMLARAACEAMGLTEVERVEYGQSRRPELRGVDQHHLSVGMEVAVIETTCLEARRP